MTGARSVGGSSSNGGSSVIADRDNNSEVIEADSDANDHASLSSTRSARRSIYEFVEENGRTYHSYAQGSYMLPNDYNENIRLDLQHWIFRSLLHHDYFAPLQDPKKILDIGTGTGTWAVKMAELFPNATITGTDLSPVQPSFLPKNVQILIDDASDEDWGNHKYNYIHMRMMLGCFTDFKAIIQRSFKYLQPGGFLESHELFPPPYCDDGTLKADNAFLQWTRKQDEAAMIMGRPLRIANKLKRWYEEAGFVDVHEEVFKIPINPWPKDPRFKMLGRFWETVMLDGLQGFTLAYFYRAFGWTQDEIEVYLVNVRRAISDRSVHAYHKIYVVWGRKPGEAES